MKEPNFSFSPEDFKKWMDHNEKEEAKRQKQNNLVGMVVESKISTKRLIVHIKPKDGELHELASDFRNSGGTIYDVEGKNLLIEVNSGFFYIPRYFVKKRANEE